MSTIASDDELYQKFNLIPSEQLEYGPVCGHGTFGQIRIARWNGTIVATKSFHYKQNFHAEIKHFPQDEHPNIIKLFGICPKHSLIVLEYAELGSLDHILHERADVKYKLSHAINWCLQVARGVSYLHSIKPKPMMHRDLKPPNLLLFDEGQTIKLCDFGTLRMVDTEVTNQRGSAAWMAPEVFQTKSYSEKCDIYSWGIILWEVLSRRKPYEDITESCRIFWLVAAGLRPPLLKECPEVLERLMVRCWDKDISQRPDIHTVETIMQKLFDFYIDENSPSDSLCLYVPSIHSSTSSHDSSTQSYFPSSTLTSDVLNVPLPLFVDTNRTINSMGAQTNASINLMEAVTTHSNSLDQPSTSRLSIGSNGDNKQSHLDVVTSLSSRHLRDSYHTYNDLDDDDFEALLSPDLVPTRPSVHNTTSLHLHELHREEAKNYLEKYFNIIVLEGNRNERLQREKEVNGDCPYSLENLRTTLKADRDKYTKMIEEQRISLNEAKERHKLRSYAMEQGWVMIG